jgi:hypothetical protein
MTILKGLTIMAALLPVEHRWHSRRMAPRPAANPRQRAAADPADPIFSPRHLDRVL